MSVNKKSESRYKMNRNTYVFLKKKERKQKDRSSKKMSNNVIYMNSVNPKIYLDISF